MKIEMKKILWSLLFCLCSVASGQEAKNEPKFEDPSFIPAPKEKLKETKENAFRILYVGNSITRHGIYLKLKWDHVAGMAASSEENDYAHRLAALIQKTMPERKVELYFGNVNEYLRKPAGTTFDKSMPHPDLVVIQTGEHEGPKKTKEEVAEIYERQLVKPFAEMKPRPLILCTGLWYVDKSYRGWVKNINDAYKEVCEKYGVPFVSVESIACDPTCRGWGEHPGVQWHPNDKGMEGYATLLFEAFQKATMLKEKK